MKRFFFIIYFAVFIWGMATAQNNKCGLPSYRPAQGQAHTYKDTCGMGYYIFNSGKWYRQFQINQTSAPQFSFLNGAFEIDNTEAIYFNTNTQRYYKAIFETGVWKWVTIAVIDYENIVFTIGNQDINGIKTFQDTTKFKKGLQSDGLVTAKAGLTSDSTITSKGVNTEGSSTKAAAEFKGVLSMKDTLITSNYTATGAYGRITGDCNASNIVLTLPTPNASNLGWCYELSKKAASSFNFRVTQGSFSHVIFSPNKIVRVRQKGGVWELD